MSSVTQVEARNTAVDSSTLTRRLAATGLILLLLVGLFYNFFERQVLFALDEPADWGHTLIIPFIALYFVYLQRDRLLRTPLRTTAIGIVPIFLGVAWYMLCSFGPRAIVHHNLQGAGVGITLFGVLLTCFGWRAMRILLPALIYLVIFGVTISDRFMNIVTERLQDIASVGSYGALMVLGLDVERSGNVLTVWDNGQAHPLNIAEACSGMRMVVAFLALGVLLAVTRLRYTWQRVTLVMLALPTAVFVNILRVMTLALLTFIDPDLAGGDFHEFIGLLWLIPGLAIYFGLIWILNRLVIDDSTQEPISTTPLSDAFASLRFDSRIGRGVVAVCVALVVSAAGFRGTVYALNVHLKKEAVGLRRPLNKIPRQIGGWQATGEDQLLDESVVKELGTRNYLNRIYVKNGNPSEGALQLHIAFYTGMIDAVPHVPERCWTASGLQSVGNETVDLTLDTSSWRIDDRVHQATNEPYRTSIVTDPITRRGEDVRMPVGDLGLRIWEFQGTGTDQAMRMFAGYFFLANGRTTASPQLVRAWAFDRSTQYAYYAKVEFAAVSREMTRADFEEKVKDLLTPLLPEVMRCLPDWAEVEAGTYPVKNDLSGIDLEGLR